MKLYEKENSLLVLFSFFQMLYQLSFNIVVPFFSIILLSSGWSEKNITYFFSIAAFTVFMFAPIIGKISDYYSKKTIMIFGLLSQVVFSILYYFFIEIVWVVYIARLIETIGFIAISVVGFGALEDLIKIKRGYWTGIFLTFGTLGALLGPVVAGYISELYQEKLLFLLGAGIFSITTLFLILIPLKTSIKKRKSHKSLLQEINPLSEIRHFVETKRMRGMALFGILMNAKGQIFAIFFPIYVISTLGFSESTLGILLTIPVLMHLFQYYLGKISDTVSSQFGVLCGVFINSCSLFFLPYINSFTILIFMLIVMGIGSSIWNVSAWSLMGEYAKKNNLEGQVTGTYFSISKLGALIATLSSSLLLTIFEIDTMIQIFAIITLISMTIAYLLFQPIFHHEEKENEFIKHLP